MENLKSISTLKQSKNEVVLTVKDCDIDGGHFFVSGFVYDITCDYVRIAVDGKINNIEYKNIIEIKEFKDN